MKKNANRVPVEKVIPYRAFKACRYPNSAGRSYYRNRLIDCALAAVTCLGGVSAFGFLILL